MEKNTAGSQKNGVRFTRFVFTLNNYTDDEYESLQNLSCRWIVIGKEISPTTNTPHLQGAVILKKQTALSTLKSTPGLVRAHMELMRGSPEDSLVYCSKEDQKPYIRGSMPEPGKRTDIASACDMLKDGKTMKDVAVEMPTVIVKYHKGLIHLRALLHEGRREKPTVFWLSGETGTGKTKCAVELGEHYGSYWISSGNLRWFDGYDGQTVAILDDFRSDSCSFNFLLRLLDRYLLRVEYKGGFVDWVPKIIIVTAPSTAEYTFNQKPYDDIAQLIRRIDYSIQFPDEYSERKLFTLLGIA